MTDDDMKAFAESDTATATVARLLDEAAEAAAGLWELDSAMRAVLARVGADGLPSDAPGVLLLRAALDAVIYRLSFDNDRCTLVPYLGVPGR